MLRLENIHKNLGQFSVKGLNLKIEQGDYFVLLGSSGAGKSVVLELIAGLQHPDKGDIIYNNVPINSLKPGKRPFGMLFQDYALFPHLTVLGNIAFPLKIQKTESKKIHFRILDLAEKLEIGHLLNRKPETLSGGEKQRVALARALARQPEILLLDEPLSSLDVQLKTQIRPLLKKLNNEGQTIIHVTHDYEEAIALASKVAVMEHGRLVQTGSTADIFQHPETKFVASFIGEQNFFEASIHENPGHDTMLAKTGKIAFKLFSQAKSGKGFVLVRRKNIIISNKPTDINTLNNFEGIITDISPSRHGFEIVVDIGIPIHVAISEETCINSDFKIGHSAWISIKASSVKFYPAL